MDFLVLLDNTLNQSLVYSFLAISVYISLRLVDFPDLSIEGTFPLGAAVAAIIAKSTSLIGLSIPIAILCGFLCGVITASLHLYLKVGKLLAGIIVSVGLYSVNFRVMGANANLYLTRESNLFTPLRDIDALIGNAISNNNILIYPFSNLIIALFLVIIIFFLYRFFKTERGALIMYTRSDTKLFFQSLGINHNKYMIIGMGVSGAFAALSGALVTFQSGSASITLGMGIILVALVSLVIGEQIVKLFHKDLTDLYPTILAPIIGTFIYYLIIGIVRWLNVLYQSHTGYPDPNDQLQFFNSDIKLLSALIMIIIYFLKRKKINSLNTPESL
jgi:putative ABC transport system permease protein